MNGDNAEGRLNISFCHETAGAMFKDQWDSVVNADVLESEKFHLDVGVQAIRGPFGEREVENSAPFLAILFGDQPKGMDLKIWKGGESKGLARQPSSTSSRRFPSIIEGWR